MDNNMEPVIKHPRLDNDDNNYTEKITNITKNYDDDDDDDDGDNNSNCIIKKIINFKSILSDEYTNDIQLKPVYVGSINDMKNISKLIMNLNNCIPMKNLQYLKRVNNNQIIICKKFDVIEYFEKQRKQKQQQKQNDDDDDDDDNDDDVINDMNKYNHYYDFLFIKNYDKNIFNTSEILIKFIINKLKINQIIHILNYNNDKIKFFEIINIKNIQKLIIMYYLIENHKIDYNLAKELCMNLSIVNVGNTVPKLRWQYDKLNKLWPCKFHQNKYIELLYKNDNFNDKQKIIHKNMIFILKLLIDYHNNNNDMKNIGICFDPRDNSIIAIAVTKQTNEKNDSFNNNNNPILHCPILLIDLVARTQNGGILKYDENEYFDNNASISINNSSSSSSSSNSSNISNSSIDNNVKNLKGIKKIYVNMIKNKFQNINFGAEIIDLKNIYKLNEKYYDDDNNENDNLNKYGPYLCTGYYVYLNYEPCLMCSMALIHSRIKKLFYLNSSSNGALETNIKLHTIKELNHHFEVYRCSINDKK